MKPKEHAFTSVREALNFWPKRTDLSLYFLGNGRWRLAPFGTYPINQLARRYAPEPDAAARAADAAAYADAAAAYAAADAAAAYAADAAARSEARVLQADVLLALLRAA
jgi:hypothetical protein